MRGLLILFISVAVGMSAEALAQRGPGSTQLVPLGLFELSDQQRQALRQIRREFHTRQCELSGRIIEAQEEIRELYAKDRRDAAQIGQAFRDLAALQQKLLETRINAENRAEAVLNKEQRQTLQQWRRGALADSYNGSLPYMVHPGPQMRDFEPWNLEEPERVPIPRHGGRVPPRGGAVE